MGRMPQVAFYDSLSDFCENSVPKCFLQVGLLGLPDKGSKVKRMISKCLEMEIGRRRD